MNIIEFKGLGLKFNIDPVAIHIFNLNIYWYGIIISIGFLTGYLVLMYYAKKHNYNQEILLDLILITTPISIIGARLYYVAFRFSEYKNDFWEIFRIWHGGLAIYGAIISAVITVYIYCKVKNIRILPILDMAAPSFIIAQAIGRWGNFVNQEAYGRETTLPWAMTINEAGTIKNVHPTFLYESLWNLIVFIFLVYFNKHKKIDGEIFLLYLGLYSFGRFWIEGLRTDSLYFSIFRISQIVALVFIVLSVAIFVIRRINSVYSAKR